jgi:excisionase family DNA binding protein
MPTKIEGLKLYSLLETAKELEVSYQTVLNYVKEGKINAQRVGKPILFTEKDIKAFKKAKK